MSKMVLWECQYTLTCRLWVDKSVDYWLGINPPTQKTQQNHWDKIHPGFFTVSDFVADAVPWDTPRKPEILSREYTV